MTDNAELLKLAERVEAWHPIASAPRDGSRIIVALFSWVHSDIQRIFDQDPDQWHLCFAVTAQWDAERECWTDGLERLVDPTHWRHVGLYPLPGQGCSIPPEGWWCSRWPGHDGPCAAREVPAACLKARAIGDSHET